MNELADVFKAMPDPNHVPRWSPAIFAVACFTGLYVLAAGVAAMLSGNAEFIFYIVIMLIMIAAIWLVHWRLGLTATLLWLLAIWGLMHMAGGLVPVPQSWPIDGDIRVLYSWWIIPRDAPGTVPGTGPGTAPDQLQGWLKYDHLVHAFGYGVTALLMWQVLRALIRKYTGQWIRPTIGIMIIVVAAATGFGALNEIIEFIATLFAETNVGGYVNTGIDLVANSLGAIIAAILILLIERRAA